MTKKLFTSEYQPAGRGRKKLPSGEKKVSLSVSVKPATREYLSSHNVKGGEVLDEYVEKKK